MSETSHDARSSIVARETLEARSVWDDLENEKRRAELSHWRGVGKWEDDEKWLGIGTRTLKKMKKGLRLLSQNDSLSHGQAVLEWGPGGGANAIAFRDIATKYYGVDISKKNLAEADRVLRAEGLDYFVPVFVSDTVDIVRTTLAEPVDLFLSTAVFQHFPSKDYGLEALSVLADITRTGAFGLIQIRYDDGSKKYSGNQNIDQYKGNFITPTTYRIDEFWSACIDAGFDVICVDDLNSKVNYVWFHLLRK